MQRQRQQGTAGVVTSCRNLHLPIVGRCWGVVPVASVGGSKVRFDMGSERNSVGDTPVIPDYAGGCISNVVPALVEPSDEPPSWLPAAAAEANQVVLLVVDGLGWHQLTARASVAPTLTAMAGGPIDSVCPTTTSTALTSITTGLPPGQHGVMGYRMATEGGVLNVLRWSVNGRDVRAAEPPEKFQAIEPFCSQRPAIVTRAEFAQSGFTRAHLDGVRFRGYRVLSTLVTEVRQALGRHEPFVYAYYDGLDKVGHEYGLGEHFDAELAAIDMLVANLVSVLPRGAVLVVTADHGQVEVGDRVIRLHPEVMANCSLQSGEGRFRWLHARPGRASDLLDAARRHHSDTGWVVSCDEVVSQGWFGPVVTDAARARLGDVALVARDDVAYFDPEDTGPYLLVGRHGSMTEAEVRVPLLVGVP
jgi:predicted AlkP superfamily pyrophosphatase or phosphodiesterase